MRARKKRGGLPERPHRLPKAMKKKGPMTIRQDYGSRDGRPGAMSAISEFDADRRRNPSSSANRIIRQANQRDIDSRKKLQFEQGGEVKGGGTIKIAGQYAVDSIKTTPEGNQYVSMELPNGEVVPVFGDWETYGNPDRERRIEDLDYIIYPLGDGTYALDAAEAEAEMLRDEARGVARDSDNTEDLLQELNQRSSMRGMRPVRRQ